MGKLSDIPHVQGYFGRYGGIFVPETWVTNVQTTYYLLGSALGPHPYPTIVRDFQSIIGREARAQILEAEGRLPDACIACVGGGSNAIGLFDAFRDDPVRLIGVEAGGVRHRHGSACRSL